MQKYKCCALRGSFNLMAPNFELCCLSLPQFYRKSHGPFYSLSHKTVNAFFRKILLISERYLHFFAFASKETNRTKILLMLWCARLQIWIEDVKGEEGTFTYPPAFFLPFVFENSSQSFIEYSTVTFGFDPCALVSTGYQKRTKTIFLEHAMTSRRDCWIDSTLLY